jgi:hypothetical protein
VSATHQMHKFKIIAAEPDGMEPPWASSRGKALCTNWPASVVLRVWGRPLALPPPSRQEMAKLQAHEPGLRGRPGGPGTN